MKKIELLAPAGDLEKLKIAVDYGADAVYFGGELFSLRAGAGNLSLEDMKEGISYAHSKGVKCHLTLNIFPHNDDIEPLREYIKELSAVKPDAFIVSDPAVIMMLKQEMPECEIHLSTQANMTNYLTGEFWRRQGVSRIVLARELTLDEISCIRESLADDVEIECFAHGAMCISYSGRCLLSNFMTGRDANRGACAHPCRYKYRLEEEKRPGEYWPIEEDSRGTYIMNSKDLCMLEHIDDLHKAGVSSLKIEGRMKSIFYVAHVIKAYRQAIDSYYDNPEGWKADPELMSEMCKASHREFTTGFYYSSPGSEGQNYLTSSYTRDYSFTGLVKSYDPETGFAVVEQRNKMNRGDTVEVFGPEGTWFTQVIDEMYNEEGAMIDSAPHPQQILRIKMIQPVAESWMMRKENR